MDDIETLRELLTSVYLTQRQRAALGRVLGSAARAPRRVLPLSAAQKAAVTEPRILNEAEKERERIELLGRCGAE